MEISEGVIRRGRDIVLDVYNCSKDTQPHSLIVKYKPEVNLRTIRSVFVNKKNLNLYKSSSSPLGNREVDAKHA